MSYLEIWPKVWGMLFSFDKISDSHTYVKFTVLIRYVRFLKSTRYYEHFVFVYI